MAAGKPVVSTDLPSGVSWVNQHEYRLVCRRDAGRSRGSRRLMGDAALRARFGAAGRARVEDEFTFGRLRERLRLLYEESAVLPPWPAAC